SCINKAPEVSLFSFDRRVLAGLYNDVQCATRLDFLQLVQYRHEQLHFADGKKYSLKCYSSRYGTRSDFACYLQ
ncbi:TPA: hypothetical protein ACRUWO_004396, partial [Escherichia coli]